MQGIRLTPPSYQDLKIWPQHAKGSPNSPKNGLADPGKGVSTTPLNT